ncbi:helical backbone metal receptor [Vibrio rumoiensis]|uniref:Cobalamin-binding protein n=1 Tax=Vibrio rumoiensis 1S-45 TaxID=1188252 RepID=A0A1E5DYC6_9VIBR|nr:helical backbone metal receptor [Vibrio rumoiensis]OEF22622.1 cobalamin-binding protein [Vibrio rumoiensis 1S-45]
MPFLLLFIVSLLPIAVNAHPIAQRIITLSPHATELAYSAGLGSKIIAVSEASDYPEEAQKIETVANYQGIKLERILALKPDLVIAWSKSAYTREMQQLSQFGIPILYSSIQSLDDIPNTILRLSQWAEDPTIGEENALLFQKTLTQLRDKYQNATQVRYFFQLSQKPIISVSEPNWPSDIFSVCGGKNILSHAAAPYPQVGLEQLITAKPEVIFTTNNETAKNAQWRNWTQIPAVEHQFIWSLNANWINRPTMRSLKAIDQVCHYLDTVRSKKPQK